jgi:GAF domain-containing protein
MPFASSLRESLQVRGSEVPSEFTRGDSLEHVLNRHLLAVEQNFHGELTTSILLLSGDGKLLSHGGGPNLPISYREAIDGSEIGPCAGSCGTAAFFNRPVYVADIATDPLWAEYRHIALPHGFRSCWSTPIRDGRGAVLGTFATYHRTVGEPTSEEIEAIELVTDHVADAILWARDSARESPAPKLRLVANDRAADATPKVSDRLLRYVKRLEALADRLDRHAETAAPAGLKAELKVVVADSRRLACALSHEIVTGGKPD